MPSTAPTAQPSSLRAPSSISGAAAGGAARRGGSRSPRPVPRPAQGARPARRRRTLSARSGVADGQQPETGAPSPRPALDLVLDRARPASGSRRRRRGSAPPAGARSASAASSPPARRRARSSTVALVPGSDHEVGARDVGRRAREAHRDAGLGGQRVDVGEVADPAQAHDRDLERVRPAAAPGPRARRPRARASPRRRATARRRQGSTPSVGRPVSAPQRARGRAARMRRSPRNLLMTKPAIERLVVRLEQRQRAEQRRRTRRRGRCRRRRTTGRSAAAGEAHVGEVAVAQVDLGRAARALADDDVEARAQVGERVEHDLAQRPALELLVAARVRVA